MEANNLNKLFGDPVAELESLIEATGCTIDAENVTDTETKPEIFGYNPCRDLEKLSIYLEAKKGMMNNE